MNVLKVAARNIGRNTRRSVLSGLAIFLSVTGIVFLFGMLGGINDALSDNVQNFVSGQVRIRHTDFDKYEHLSPLHLAIVDADGVRREVEEHPAVQSATARIPFGGLYFHDDDNDGEVENFGLQVLGADFDQEERYLQISELLLQGRLPNAGANEAVVGGALLERFGLSVGDRMTLLVTTFARGSNAFTAEIVGVIDFPYAALSRGTVMIPLDRAQYYLRAGSAATEILIKVTDDYSPEQVSGEISHMLGSDQFSVKHWLEISSSASFISTSRTIYSIIALVVFILSSTVIVNTTMMVIFERIREIGMLGAIGMSSGQIVLLFYVEALIIGAFGALAGVAVGSGLVGYLGFAGFDLGNQISSTDFQVSSVIYPRNRVITVVSIFFYAVAITGLTTLIPARRCAKIKPVEALRQAT